MGNKLKNDSKNTSVNKKVNNIKKKVTKKTNNGNKKNIKYNKNKAKKNIPKKTKDIVKKDVLKSNKEINSSDEINVSSNTKLNINNNDINNISELKEKKIKDAESVKEKNIKVTNQIEVKSDISNPTNNNIFLIILFVIIMIIVLFLPKIYDYIETSKLPKVQNQEKLEKEEQNQVVDKETLENIHFPLMRNSVYNVNTYYLLKKFTLSDMSNSDILLTAFLDIYEGNMTTYESTGDCTNVSKQFSQSYLDLRIKNILGKNLDYSLESFYVPEDLNSNYVGEWIYDNMNDRYIYKGLCKSNASNVKYYNLEQLIKAEYFEDSLLVYYYVGFAKVEGNSYVIYSDAEMKKEILVGTITDSSELNNIFKKIENKKKGIYKYTFKDTICSYNEYCLYGGEWINEL